jgi:hypothetical protein
MRRWLASILCPEMERDARRYWYLWHQVDDVHKWCDGEARDVGQFLLDQDFNHWRSLDTRPRHNTTYGGISGFREWLYRKRQSAPV